jgi:hypothetical protein
VNRIFTLMALALFALPASQAQAPAPGGTTTGAQTAPVVLTLADALERAKTNSPQFQGAVAELGLAREDRYQARAALLCPSSAISRILLRGSPLQETPSLPLKVWLR